MHSSPSARYRFTRQDPLKQSACVRTAEGCVPLADKSDLTVTDIKTIMDDYMIFTSARGQHAVSATQF